MQLDLHFTLPPAALADLVVGLALWHQQHPTSMLEVTRMSTATTEATTALDPALAQLALLEDASQAR
jgi:hypothetical protein